MANLWLSSSADKTIDVGDSVTLTAYLDPSTVSSDSTSSYRAKIMIDGSLKGSASTWSVSGSQWKTSCSYTFNTAGEYEVAIALCNSSGSYLNNETGSITVYVEDTTGTLTVNYYDGSTSDTGNTTTTYITLKTPSRSGWTFAGWATSTKTEDVDYDGGEKVYAGSSDETLNLYAVYYIPSTITCYYGVNMASSNSRTKYQWRWNTSKTAYSTSNYTMSPSYLPNFNPSTMTVLGRTFTGIGWREDTTAAAQTYDPGETITPSGDVDTYYAVYSNTDGIYVSYNSNGGSGTMSSATVAGTLYYNTAGNNTRITVTPRTCTFTPPTGQTFQGWSTSATGSIVTSISTAYDATFYAIWGSAKPDQWSWTSSIGGTLTLTKISEGNYEVYPLTAKEWNAFLDRIREWGEYLNISLWDSDFTNAAAIQNNPMDAQQAIFAVSLLEQLGASPPSAPSSGSSITANFINGLATAINSLG